MTRKGAKEALGTEIHEKLCDLILKKLNAKKEPEDIATWARLARDVCKDSEIQVSTEAPTNKVLSISKRLPFITNDEDEAAEG